LIPNIDIAESNTNIIITTEHPGLDEKDIDVHFSDHALVIKGGGKRATEVTNKDYQRVERVFGSLNRTIPIPVEVDSEKFDAQFKNGVLEITLPKTEKTKSKIKNVEVKASE
jgi:HSP20 family protein